jgi:hypothetical protein
MSHWRRGQRGGHRGARKPNENRSSQQPCKYYAAGRCTSHSCWLCVKAPQRLTVPSGTFGDECKFSHDAGDIQTLRRLAPPQEVDSKEAEQNRHVYQAWRALLRRPISSYDIRAMQKLWESAVEICKNYHGCVIRDIR